MSGQTFEIGDKATYFGQEVTIIGRYSEDDKLKYLYLKFESGTEEKAELKYVKLLHK